MKYEVTQEYSRKKAEFSNLDEALVNAIVRAAQSKYDSTEISINGVHFISVSPSGAQKYAGVDDDEDDY
jgi:hypothetical protein